MENLLYVGLYIASFVTKPGAQYKLSGYENAAVLPAIQLSSVLSQLWLMLRNSLLLDIL
jgi:hypothetical protein